jgi:hypothetical protein
LDAEARIVATLNHPNICQLYDIGPHMLVMEYVVGTPVALKALSLEEGDVGAHVALAIETDWYEWDWAGADREFRRALEIDPVDGRCIGILLLVPAVDGT